MKVLKLFFTGIKNEFSIFLEILTNRLDTIENIATVFVISMNTFMIFENGKTFLFAMEIISLIFIIFLMICSKILETSKALSTGFPIKEKRLTKKGLDGQIYIEPSDLKLAIVYLKEIEDYAERNGFLKR